MLLSVLNNQDGPPKDIVVFNAGVALYAANVVNSIEDGLVLARETLASGAAKRKLDQWLSFTQQVQP
jgi:anthranilate phosphoribosyltransferase